MLLAVAATALASRPKIHLGHWEIIALVAASGFLALTLLSALWSPSTTWPLRESERTLVYVSGLLSMLLVIRRSGYRMLVIGVWAGTMAVGCYGLATRLFPGWHSTFDSFGGYRLSEPIGYWNGLGVLAAMGVLLSLGMAARSDIVAVRAIAALAVPILMTGLYFTYSRGAWIALALGLMIMFALDEWRLRLLTSTLISVAWAAAAVYLASRSVGLTHVQASQSSASHDGRHLAVELAALGLGASLSALLLVYAERHFSVDPKVRNIYAVALALALIATLALALVRYGDPVTLARQGYHSLNASQPQSVNLNRRLFNLSSPNRVDHWRVAWTEYGHTRGLGRVLVRTRRTG